MPNHNRCPIVSRVDRRPVPKSKKSSGYLGRCVTDGDEVEPAVRDDEVRARSSSRPPRASSSPPPTGIRQMDVGARQPSHSRGTVRPSIRLFRQTLALPGDRGRRASGRPHLPDLEPAGPIRPEEDPPAVTRPRGSISSLGSLVSRRNSRLSASSRYRSANPSRRGIEQDGPASVRRPLGWRAMLRRRCSSPAGVRAVCVGDPELLGRPSAWTRKRSRVPSDEKYEGVCSSSVDAARCASSGDCLAARESSFQSWCL